MRSHRLLLSCLHISLVALVASLLACGSSKPPVPRPGPAEAGDQVPVAGWDRIDETEGGFSVMMPKGAIRKNDAKDIVIISWMAKSRSGSVYLASSASGDTILQPSPQKALEQFVAGVVGGCKGQLEDADQIDVDGATAIVFRATCENGKPMGGLARAQAGRIFLQLLIAVDEPKDDFKRFIRSFRVTLAVSGGEKL